MTRRDVVAAAAHVPWLAHELHQLSLGDLGTPYTRYFCKLPKWARMVVLVVLFVVAWIHFINRDD